MGTWSAQLDGNDYFLDVYGAFQELLESGKSVQECTNEVMLEFLELSWDDIMDEEIQCRDAINRVSTLNFSIPTMTMI